jgi:hypothetical protein
MKYCSKGIVRKDLQFDIVRESERERERKRERGYYRERERERVRTRSGQSFYNEELICVSEYIYVRPGQKPQPLPGFH